MNFTPQLPFDFSVSERSTFHNFLVSPKNAELLEVLQSLPLSDDSMVFIWGKEGTGKSHLLQALCHACEESGARQALYLATGKIRMFGPEVFSSLHHMDLICIDDIQTLLGDAAWEESLFAFFNRARDAGVKLVISATSAPRALDFSLPDLASRLSWGMVYHLHELDDDVKLEALQQRAETMNMPIPVDVLQYLYHRHPRNLQSLLEVLERLDQLSLAEKKRLTTAFVRQVMGWQA